MAVAIVTGIELAIGAGIMALLTKKPGSNAFTGKSSSQEMMDDGAILLARANQPAALDWAKDFVAAGASPGEAAALARWAGIESGGNPLSVSRLKERGLFQASEKEGRAAYTQKEWDAILDKGTSRVEQAKLAMKFVDWLANQAASRGKIGNMPTNPVDRIWYAKLWHQYPKDVVRARLHGPARLQAMELQHRWGKEPKTLHRLRAASAIAFGEATV